MDFFSICCIFLNPPVPPFFSQLVSPNNRTGPLVGDGRICRPSVYELLYLYES